MTILAIFTAFLGGLVSFLSPCVLPIIPGFLAYLAGSGTKGEVKRKDVFMSSVYFVLGFALVFALLGVILNQVLGSTAFAIQIWLSRIGGVIIIFFGLYLVGLISLPFLDKEYKFKTSTKFSSRHLTSFLFGLAFAAGWTPCVGPVLGVIIGLAVSSPGSAFLLFLSYAVGLGIPFLLVGAFAAQASTFIAKYERIASYINKIFGVILIVLGILVFTGTLASIASFDFLNRFITR
ncbi:MAG: cytochrome c-type biosis protein CcdA [Parcubacteria group bacterium]|nr:cytochrome c-type biosis protein CcdA [Parcubacteria group bacterium]